MEDSLKNYFKTKKIKSLPNILIVFLNQFELDKNTGILKELNNHFEFPFELDMKDYLIKENNEINTEYELTGITVNDILLHVFYFYDLIKMSDDNWYEFSQSKVKQIDEYDIPFRTFGRIKDLNLDKSEGRIGCILIYTRKNFSEEKIENFGNNLKIKFAKPPYDKMSYIKDEYKSIINLEMYHFWTLMNIMDPLYQNFVLNLYLISLLKNKNIDLKIIEKKYPQIFKKISGEGYLDSKNNDEENEINNNKIFEFGLRYFFNVLLRINKRDRNSFEDYYEIIKLFLEFDREKCKFILEEFSNKDTLNEFLVFCPIKENIEYVSNIIMKAFKTYYDDKKINDKSILFKYINTLLLFIYLDINNICLEFVINLFISLINVGKNKIFVNHLKESGIEFWLSSLDKVDITEEDEEIINSLMSSTNLPIISSTHFILSEKENIDDKNENNNTIDEEDIKRLSNIEINYNLIRKFGFELNKLN